MSGPVAAARRTVGGIGAPHRLPLRVAFQVAWTSIRVRLARSLVTVSSVVLAVAFLLVVLGESASIRAVWNGHRAQTAPERASHAVRTVLEKARSPLVLLGLIADQSAEVTQWEASLAADTANTAGTANTAKPPFPAADPAAAADLHRLARWIDGLKATQVYLLTHNRDVTDWLLHLDAPDAAKDALATAKTFKGVRFPFTAERLTALAGKTALVRAAVERLVAAEHRRLEQVKSAGGPEEVLRLVVAGADNARLVQVGLPLGQVLPRQGAAERQALVDQLGRERLRTTADQVLAGFRRTDQSLLVPEDLDQPGFIKEFARQCQAEGKTAGKRLAQLQPGLARFAVTTETADTATPAPATTGKPAPALDAVLDQLNRALARPQLYAKDVFTMELHPDAAPLLKQNLNRLSERKLTRLNRILLEAAFPGVIRSRQPVPARLLTLAAVEDGSLLSDSAADKVKAALVQALTGGDQVSGAKALAELRADLTARRKATVLTNTFSTMGYEPEASQTRTFWLVVLSLLVCVVGIVNTMMMAVTERFREIATMKCLGAQDNFILKAFIIESAAMGVVGAAVGSVFGLFLVVLQAGLRFGSAFWSAFPTGDLAVVLGISAACGLGLAIFGALLPAWQASRMAPIEAMRIDL